MSNKASRVRPLYVHIAKAIQWRSGVTDSYRDRAEQLVADLQSLLISGGGFDNGVKIDDTSTANKLILTFDYHYMNESGYYTKWTSHKVTVLPSLCGGIDLKITKGGASEHDLEYFYDTFYIVLLTEYSESFLNEKKVFERVS